MNIKSIIYENLTPRQRLIASIEAMARGDDSEHEKLARTCPRKSYQQADYQYSGAMQNLLTAAIAVEHELTSNVLSLFLAIRMERYEFLEMFLQKIVDGYAAWNRQMQAMGIDPRSMEKVIEGMRHPLVSLFLKADFDGIFKANEDGIKEHLACMERFFKFFCDA